MTNKTVIDDLKPDHGSPSIREANVEAFLDAAERLLIREGAAGISTRQLAREAGQNHGLVHYYFGSVDELLLQTLERFTERVLERQRAMYEAEKPFAEKWRTAIGFIEEDLASGYPKVWAELEAIAWNKPEVRDRLNRVNERWRSLLRDAVAKAIDEYDLERPLLGRGSGGARHAIQQKPAVRAAARVRPRTCRAAGLDRRLAHVSRGGKDMKTIMESGVAIPPARETTGRDGEQSRAAYPDTEGFAERDGQRLFYEVYGEGEETVFLLPTWSLVHSRHWKMQIPYFSRHFRVLTMDGLGNGRSDRCRDPRRYDAAEFARDCLAVMDASDTDRAVMASLSRGAQYPARAGSARPGTGRSAPPSSAPSFPTRRPTGRS